VKYLFHCRPPFAFFAIRQATIAIITGLALAIEAAANAATATGGVIADIEAFLAPPSFDFSRVQRTVRIITADIPGRGKKIVWYMWYQVINKTGDPRVFIPDFELVTTDKNTSHNDEVLPSVEEVIKRIEQTHLPHEYPAPKALHHSQVDRTKVGWQLLPAPFIDLAGVPTYVRYIVVSKIRAAMLAITVVHLALRWAFDLPDLISFGLFMVWIVCLFGMMGLTMGNLTALAMEPVGHIAGFAASMIGALSTVLSVVLSAPIGLAFDGTPVPLIAGSAVLLAGCLLLMRFAGPGRAQA
jgi:hypothetical protein